MTTQLTSIFVLPSDVMLIPVTELSPATRDHLECAPGDVAITRPLSRRPSSVVDANAAGLLELFRAPSTVVDAIVKFSRATSADPRAVLENAFPLVERMVTSGILIPSGDERARPIDGSVQRGDTIGDFTIVDRVQILEDVEIHRARSSTVGFAAVKIARRGHVDAMRKALGREAGILRRLAGRGAPTLLVAALDAPLPYLALSWCSGVPPTRALDDHPSPNVDSRGARLDLCARIAAAYAELHERGILHGDVHDRNVLVGPDSGITLLDFGLAVALGDDSKAGVPRGGVPEYYDPQLAASQTVNAHPPALDACAEQYSVAALLYLVFTGHTYIELALRRADALRQIVEDLPLSFEARGVAPWPEVEGILRRALSKSPAERFPSVRAFAEALRSIAAPIAAAAVATRSADRRRFVSALIERLEPGGPIFNRGLPAPPLCSVNNGAAGIAYAFHRMAAARDDAQLFAYAEAWIARARAWQSDAQAWYTHDGLITRKDVGTSALYHSDTGVDCVEALIALAGGEEARAEWCVNQFIAASRKRASSLDLTLGTAGLVLGATLMLEATPTPWPPLRKRGADLVARIERRIAAFGPIVNEPSFTYLGMAHGWSGLLWTLLRWYRATGTEVPGFVEARLGELADLATPRGRGLAWVWSADPRQINAEPHPAPTWCNGTAGHVHTWLEAHAAFRKEQYLDLARAAAWNVWDDSRDELKDACCGLVGRAYALLALSRRTGDTVWRQRAERLADRALDTSVPEAAHAHRLYKGELGVALLIEELESAPDHARMPLFEAEGWRWERQ